MKKVGLSNHQSVCPSPTNNFWTAWLHFHEIWYGGNAIQGDLDTVMFLSRIFNHFKMVEVQNC
jgi:hypothetical protein